MLSKCASPACSNTFRYLHEGKLYLIDSKTAFAGRKHPDQAYEGKSALEYVWLCSSCCRDLMIHADPDFGISVVPKETAKNSALETRPLM
jgi:hypothetical protein